MEKIGKQAFDPSVVILGYPYGPAPDFASANGNAFYSYGANRVSWNYTPGMKGRWFCT